MKQMDFRTFEYNSRKFVLNKNGLFIILPNSELHLILETDNGLPIDELHYKCLDYIKSVYSKSSIDQLLATRPYEETFIEFIAYNGHKFKMVYDNREGLPVNIYGLDNRFALFILNDGKWMILTDLREVQFHPKSRKEEFEEDSNRLFLLFEDYIRAIFS